MTGTVDYRAEYSDYWSREDRWASHSFDDPAPIIGQILGSCGVGPTLDVGCGMGALVLGLLREGIDARGVDVAQQVVDAGNVVAPGRFCVGSILDLPYGDNQFHTVVSTDCLEHLARADVLGALRELYRVTRCNVFLRIATAQDRDQHWHLTIEGRAWWEQQLFQAGFRKHPKYYQVNSYESLERDGNPITILVQKIQPSSLLPYPLAMLHAKRNLQMDMLRETGRRSDAHVVRYHLAAQYVRPGDAVLDVACGLGYGAAVLFSNSQASRVLGQDESIFAVEYAQSHFASTAAISFVRQDLNVGTGLPASSVDFVTCFETLAHLKEPEKFIAEVYRVLRPTGRLVVSVASDWSDESGADPDPHHFHVYTWDGLQAQLSRHFLIEKAWSQVAGGGVNLTEHPRRLAEVPVDRAPGTAEWILILVMKSPFADPDQPYVETTYPEFLSFSKYHATAFFRDYSNPWLLKAIVAIGMRASNPQLLQRIARQAEQQSRVGTADRGAALCVQAYQMLNKERLESAVALQFLQRVDLYLEHADMSPLGVRWTVSLLFVKGLFSCKMGFFREAEQTFGRCANIDVSPFSPLLLTKTADALYYAGLLALQDSRPLDAAGYWQQALPTLQRVLVSYWKLAEELPPVPPDFEMAEIAQAVLRVSRCLACVRTLDKHGERGGLAWRLIWNDLEARYQSLSQGARGLTSEVEDLRKGNQWLEAQRNAWQTAATERAGHVKWLEEQRSAWERAATERAGHVKWLEEQRRAWERAATERAGHVKWLEEQRSAWERAATERAGHVKWLEEQRSAWERAATERAGHVKWLEEQRRAWERAATERAGHVKWLEEQRSAWERAAAERAGHVKWLEEQRSAWETAAAERASHIKWLEEQRSAWEATATANSAQIDVLRLELATVTGKLNALSGHPYVRLARKLGLVKFG